MAAANISQLTANTGNTPEVLLWQIRTPTHTDVHIHIPHRDSPTQPHPPISILYLCGCLASSIMGMTLVLFFATLIRSRPERWENSTAYTSPSWMEEIEGHSMYSSSEGSLQRCLHTHTHAYTHTAIKMTLEVRKTSAHSCTCHHASCVGGGEGRGGKGGCCVCACMLHACTFG